MQFNLANILVFLGLAVGFLVMTLTIGRILRPHKTGATDKGTYECGEKPITQAWFNFNPRFYIVALVFLIFDVEIAFTYPVAAVFRRWVDEGAGAFAFVELFVFMAILLLGLAYVWRKGDLEWIRKVVSEDEAAKMAAQDRAPPGQPSAAAETKKAA